MSRYRRKSDGIVVDAQVVTRPTVIATPSVILKGNVGDWLVSEEIPKPLRTKDLPTGLKQFFVTGETFKIMYEIAEGQS